MDRRQTLVVGTRVGSKAVGSISGFVGRVVEYTAGGRYIVADAEGREWMRDRDELSKLPGNAPLTSPKRPR